VARGLGKQTLAAFAGKLSLRQTEGCIYISLGEVMVRILGTVLMVVGAIALLMGVYSADWISATKSEERAPGVKLNQKVSIGLTAATLCKERCVAEKCEEKCKTETHEEELGTIRNEQKRASRQTWVMVGNYTQLGGLVAGILLLLSAVLVALRLTPLGPVAPERIANFLIMIPMIGVALFVAVFLPPELKNEGGAIPIDKLSTGPIFSFIGAIIAGVGCSLGTAGCKKEREKAQQDQAIASAPAPAPAPEEAPTE
jgi:hypothetical protein